MAAAERRKHARGDLSDAQWALIEGLFPKQLHGGKWNDHRLTFDGILWILRTGAPWRDLPERYGKWQSVYDRFNRYRKSGVFDRILKALRIRLDKDGFIDWDLWCVDGSNVRASRSAAGAAKKPRTWPKTQRSRAGALARRMGIQTPPRRGCWRHTPCRARLVNLLREDVRRWRLADYRGASTVMRDLLKQP